MKNTLNAFLDGFSGGSLLAWTSLPGSATQVFADGESTQPQEELVQSLLRIQEKERVQCEEIAYAHAEEGIKLPQFPPKMAPPPTPEFQQGDVTRVVARQSATSSLARALSAEIGPKKAARILRRALLEVEKEAHGA